MASDKPRKKKVVKTPAAAPVETARQWEPYEHRTSSLRFVHGELAHPADVPLRLDEWAMQQDREAWSGRCSRRGMVEFGNGKPGCGVWLTRAALGLSVDLDEELPDPDELWARKPEYRTPWMSSWPTWQCDGPVAMPVIDYVYSSRSGSNVPVLLPSREAVWEQRYAKVAGDRDKYEHRRTGGKQRKQIESRYELVEREWIRHLEELRFQAVEAALEAHPDWDEQSPEMDDVFEKHRIPEHMNPKGTPRREATARFREAVALWRDRAVKQTGKTEFAVLAVPQRGASRWQRDEKAWREWAVRSPWWGQMTVGGVRIPLRRWYFLWDEDRVWDARWQAWSQVLGLLIDGFVPGGE